MATDSRFFRAHTAAAACADPGFTLMGRRLRAMSACHYTLLAEAESPLLSGVRFDDLDLIDLEVISRICSQARPTADLTDLSLEALVPFAERRDEELDVLNAWLLLCYDARPWPRGDMLGGTAPESGVPLYLWIVTALLRECSGYTRDQLWYDLPVAELHWLYESMREQRDGTRTITEDGERPPTRSAEDLAHETAQRAQRDRLAERIFTAADDQMKKLEPRAAILPQSEYRAAQAAVLAERSRLLELNERDRLTDDLHEIPTPAPAVEPAAVAPTSEEDARG